MIVRELLTRLGFDADNDGAKRHERALFNVRRAATAVVSSMFAVRGAMIVAARQTATAAVETDRFARLANASTTEFQRMAAGAGTVGIESEKLSDILKDMNDRVGDFVQTGGGPMLDFFENIAPKVGVTAANFKDLSGPEALQLYVSSLEKANLSQADMVFYMEAIASDSTALLPILQNNGAALTEIADRAERFGAILSDDVIKAGKDFQTSFAGVQQIFRGLVYTIGEKMLPVITETLKVFLEWYDANGEMIRQNVGRFVDKLTEIFGTLWRVLSTVLTVANDVAQSMGGWEVVMRLIIAALVTLTASGIIRGLAALAANIRAAGGAAIFLGSVLKRIPGMLLLIAFTAVLEDLWMWVKGSESAIGKLLGTWDDFKARWAANFEAIQNPLDAFAAYYKSVWETIIAPILEKLGFLDPVMDAWNTMSDVLTSAMDKVAGSVEWLTGAWDSFKKSVGVGDIGMGVPAYGAAGGVNPQDLMTHLGSVTPSRFDTGGQFDTEGLNSYLNSISSPSVGGGTPTANVNTNITLQMPPGTPQTQAEFVQQEVVPIVRREISNAVDRSIRNYAGGE